MFIKVCGMTTAEAVQAALDARVDAIGFVFAESKRQVTPERRRELAKPARGRVALRRRDAASRRRPRSTRSSKSSSPTCCRPTPRISRARAAARARLLPVLRAGDGEPQPLPARVLFEGPVSGTGVGGLARARASSRAARS